MAKQECELLVHEKLEVDRATIAQHLGINCHDALQCFRRDFYLLDIKIAVELSNLWLTVETERHHSEHRDRLR